LLTTGERRKTRPPTNLPLIRSSVNRRAETGLPGLFTGPPRRATIVSSVTPLD
jgi:hypothetical protein